MRKRLRVGGTVLLGMVLAGSLAVAPAQAVPPFFEGFKALYLKPDSSEANDKAFVALVEKTKCGVCHLSGKNRKDRNIYGKAVGTLLSEDDKGDREKIRQTLLTVAAQPSDPTKVNSPSFGQLLQHGKLPAGVPKPSTTPTAPPATPGMR